MPRFTGPRNSEQSLLGPGLICTWKVKSQLDFVPRGTASSRYRKV